MKNTFIAALFVLAAGQLLAQPKRLKYKELVAGDPMPDYTFTNLINYTKKSAKYSEFKDKLLILDFWSTGCSSCIALWPKVLKLQEEFKDKMQFILVNEYQDEATVRKTFARRKQLAGVDMNLPAVCGDTVLNELFTHSGLPHMVWIYQGKVVARTTTDLTPENIRLVLNNKKPKVVQVNAGDYARLELNQPLFINGNTGNASNVNVVWESIFTRYNDRLRPNYDWYCNYTRGYSIGLINSDIHHLYRIAYGQLLNKEYDNYETTLDRLPYSRIFLEVPDKDKYRGYRNGAPDNSYTFSYQLYAPPVSPQKMLQRMQSDLGYYIGLDAKWEKRTLKCVVLSATDTLLAAPKAGEKLQTMGYKADYQFKFNNIKMEQFVDWLAGEFIYTAYPFIDETGMKGYIGGIDEKDVNPENPADLDRALSKHGLRVTLQDRTVEVLVLREPPGYVFPFAAKAPIPGTSKAQNLQVSRGRTNSSVQIKYDAIKEAVKYRTELKAVEGQEWKVRYSNTNMTWFHGLDAGEYLFRVAGMGKNDELKTDFNNTSELKYSEVIKITVN